MSPGASTILLVEDEAVTSMVTAGMLENEGYSVIPSFCGEEAIEIVKREQGKIDLVLMDIDLGSGMDGTQAAREILRECNLPVMFLSSHTERDVVKKTEEITAFGYVVKNSGDIVLLASVKMALKLYNAHRKIQEHSAVMRSMFEASPAGVALLVNRVFTHVSASLCAILGRTEDELVGRSTRVAYCDEGEYERVERELYHQMKDKGTATMYSRLRHACGRPIDVYLCLSPFDRQDLSKGVTVTALDITDQKKIEKAFRRSESRFRSFVENAPVGIFHTTIEGRIIMVNPAFAAMFGYSSIEEIIGVTNRTGIAAALYCSHEQREALISQGIRQDDWVSYENMFVRKNGEIFTGRLAFHSLKNAEGEVFGIEGYVVDISEQKRAEKMLRESEEKYRLLVEHATDGIVVAQDGVLKFSNPKAWEIFGNSSAEMEFRPFIEMIHPEDRKMVFNCHLKRLRGGEVPECYQFRIVSREGEVRWVEIHAVLISWTGALASLNFISDITARKQAEEMLIKALNEKDLLLQEVQHRTKNSINIISGIVTLEARQAGEESIRKRLYSIRDRVNSISSLYGLLSCADSISEINLGQYLSSLLRSLSEAYDLNSGLISFSASLDEVSIDVKRAVPVGLIANELVTNAIKYAFPGNRRGSIRVSLKRESTTIVLEVRDDGVGIAAGVHEEKCGSLGTHLVQMLVNQLKASVEKRTDHGVSVTITIPA